MTHKSDIYMKNILSRKIKLPFLIIGNNIKYNIQNKLSLLEGKITPLLLINTINIFFKLI